MNSHSIRHLRLREERDAFIDKRGHSTHANIVPAIDALRRMGHRLGDIKDEGEGCGIIADYSGPQI